MCQKKRAFTLIELLVVIAIISLLLAIIVPSLRAVKEKAQFLICRVNLKSYGLTMKLYLSEQDDRYPESQTSMFDSNQALSDGIPLNCQWHDERISPSNNPQYAGPLWKYMDNQKAHMCPTFQKFAKVYGDQHPGHNASIPIDPQYAFSQNAFLGRSYGAMKETQVVSPGKTLVWVEETIWLISGWAGWTLNDTCFFSRHWQDGVGWGDFIATYHQTPIERPEEGLGEAVFVDGHVELCDPYQAVQLQGGGEARAGFILSWPLKGKYSSTMPY